MCKACLVSPRNRLVIDVDGGCRQDKCLPVSIPVVIAAQHIVELVAVCLHLAEDGLAGAGLAGIILIGECCPTSTQVNSIAVLVHRVALCHLHRQTSHVIPSFRIDADALCQTGIDKANFGGIRPGTSQISSGSAVLSCDDSIAEYVAIVRLIMTWSDNPATTFNDVQGIAVKEDISTIIDEVGTTGNL